MCASISYAFTTGENICAISSFTLLVVISEFVAINFLIGSHSENLAILSAYGQARHQA